MKQFNNSLYKIFQALSLDVVTGTIVFTLAIGSYYKVHVPWSVVISLSIATWIIYTCDHLLDAKKIAGRASTYRHLFHQKYQKTLIVVTLILLIVGIINMYYLPTFVFNAGLLGVFFSFLYFLLLQNNSFWAKEIYIAIVYTFGIFIGPVCLIYEHLQLTQWLLIPQVFLLVFANLLIFSWFDFSKDRYDGHPSMIIHWGIKSSEKRIKSILITGVILNLMIICFNSNEATFILQIILLSMYSLLILLFKQDRLFRKKDLYRIIGDGIFFIPLFYLLYAKYR